MTTETMADREGAVRQYLLYLDDPKKLRDEGEIQKRTQAVLDAKDPIEKLKALGDLERVAKVDEEPLRAGFVAHAKAWADAERVPVGAFRELNVSDELLRDAGFDLPVATRGRASRAASGNGRQRAKAVPVDAIKAFVLGQEGTFLLTDVMSGVGGSPATVRKAVDELVEAGEVERLGPMPDYSGRGRAPIQYLRK